MKEIIAEEGQVSSKYDKKQTHRVLSVNVNFVVEKRTLFSLDTVDFFEF